MVIVIKGADFSANNVGQITLPIYWDADALAYTAQIPTAFAAMSDTKKRALNKFFKLMKSNGIYAKTTNLYLPILGRVEGGVNLITPASNIGFPATNATYTGNGVKFDIGFTTPFTKNHKDSHVGAYNTTARTVSAGHTIIASASNIYAHILSRQINSTRSGFAVNGVAQMAVTDFGHNLSIGPLIGAVSESLGKVNAVIDSEIATVNTAYTGGPTAALILGGNTAGTNTSLADIYLGLLTFGSYLTTAELATYGALQTTLMTALMAA